MKTIRKRKQTRTRLTFGDSAGGGADAECGGGADAECGGARGG